MPPRWVVIKLSEVNKMKTYFNVELKNNDEKVLRTSGPFYTSGEFVSIAHDLASALKDAPKSEVSYEKR